MSVGESKSELIAWVNELLQLDYTKIEQMGTGAAYCQILDSIYGDVAMHRVKFGYPLAEYDKLNNFKILQKTMAQYNINKKIIVEKLINCRMQDNLEFLQWIKKFWSKNFFNYRQEQDYDPQSRRRTTSSSGNSSPAQSRNVSLTGSTGAVNAQANTRRVSNSISSTISGIRNSSLPERRHASANQIYSKNVNHSSMASLREELQQKNQELELNKKEIVQFQDALDQLIGERNFYFDRLRSIETITKTTESLLLDQFAQSKMPNGDTSATNIKYSTNDDAQLSGGPINQNNNNNNNNNNLYEFIKKINRILYDRPSEAETEVINKVEHDSNHIQLEQNGMDAIDPERELEAQKDQLNEENNVLLEDAF